MNLAISVYVIRHQLCHYACPPSFCSFENSLVCPKKQKWIACSGLSKYKAILGTCIKPMQGRPTEIAERTNRLSAKLWFRVEVGICAKTDKELHKPKMPTLTCPHNRCQAVSLGHVVQICLPFCEKLDLQTHKRRKLTNARLLPNPTCWWSLTIRHTRLVKTTCAHCHPPACGRCTSPHHAGLYSSCEA